MKKPKPTKTQPKPDGKKDPLSFHSIATALGVSRETVRKRLIAAGFKEDDYGLKEIVIAFAGDYFNTSDLDPKNRLALAQAIKTERENEMLAGETVFLDDVLRVVNERYILPTVQWLDDFPERMAMRCNDKHPEIAKLTLTHGTDELRTVLKTSIEKICSPNRKSDE